MSEETDAIQRIGQNGRGAAAAARRTQEQQRERIREVFESAGFDVEVVERDVYFAVCIRSNGRAAQCGIPPWDLQELLRGDVTLAGQIGRHLLGLLDGV